MNPAATAEPPYRGRFAPTPSGPLHAGSLLTALASYLCARTAQGEWLLRIDDLDRQRCRPEHTDTILRQLEAHDLSWDGEPRLQSGHIEEYEAAFARLRAQDLIYGCGCTRAQLAQTSRAGIDGPVYAGTCRDLRKDPLIHAARLRVAGADIDIEDACQGPMRRSLMRDLGDFAVRRADGQIGYQLACTVDEAAQGITEIVRGADLIGSSFRQAHLRQLLGLPRPRFIHIPLLLDAQGQKLSKQNHARPIDASAAAANLHASLEYLGQQPPAELRHAPAAEILQWGSSHWAPGRIPSASTLAFPAGSRNW